MCDGWLASNGSSVFVYFFPNSWKSFAKILVKPEILSPIIAKSGFLANGECLARALHIYLWCIKCITWNQWVNMSGSNHNASQMDFCKWKSLNFDSNFIFSIKPLLFPMPYTIQYGVTMPLWFKCFAENVAKHTNYFQSNDRMKAWHGDLIVTEYTKIIKCIIYLVT